MNTKLISPKDIKIGDVVRPFADLEALCEVVAVERIDRSSRLFLKTLDGYSMPAGIKFSHTSRIAKVGA